MRQAQRKERVHSCTSEISEIVVGDEKESGAVLSCLMDLVELPLHTTAFRESMLPQFFQAILNTHTHTHKVTLRYKQRHL